MSLYAKIKAAQDAKDVEGFWPAYTTILFL